MNGFFTITIKLKILFFYKTAFFRIKLLKFYVLIELFSLQLQLIFKILYTY